MENRLPEIRLFATGGTIAGSADDAADMAGYQAGALDFSVLLDAVPQCRKYAKITGEQVCDIDSRNMTEKIWLELAKRVQAAVNEPSVKGVVITHGTDTMEETAWFLQLTIKTDKPIVLVGAMRPASAISADGPLNLLEAVQTAAAPESAGRGVMIVMNDGIYGADDAAKQHTFRVDTFQSLNKGSIGCIQNGRVIFYQPAHNEKNLDIDINAVTKLPPVEIIYGYGGQSDRLIKAAAAEVRGIVYAGMGNGSVHCVAEEALRTAVENGVAVVRASRSPMGVVGTAEAEWEEIGFIQAGILNSQKARILLALLLIQTADLTELKTQFKRLSQ